jgi:hypothetical protein
MPIMSYGGIHYRRHTTVPTTTLPISFGGWWYYGGSILSDEYIFGFYRSDSNTALYAIGAHNSERPFIAHNNIMEVYPTLQTGAGWRHIMAVFIATNQRFLYVNGVGDEGTIPTGATTGLDRVSFGRFDGLTAGSYADTELAEWGVWDTDLSESEVVQLASGVPPLYINRSNLLRYYPGRVDDGNSPVQELLTGQHMTSGTTIVTNTVIGPPVNYPAPTQGLYLGPTVIGAGPFPTYRPVISG